MFAQGFKEVIEMGNITRRDMLKICSGTALVGQLPLPRTANAGDVVDRISAGESTMHIERHLITEPIGGIPIISFAVVRNDIVYLSGVTADPVGDVKDQTKQVLDRIDKLLAKAGTSKSNLLSAQVWLTDMSHYVDHNSIWNAWVDRKNPPVRACLLSPQLWQSGLLVEIMVTAAK
jgi:enamine deaminase RidA (YjgF/YER057c/UK114 family)